jgi:hypothetical protein
VLGQPYITNSSEKRLMMSSDRMLLDTSNAMHRRVYSSTIDSHFNDCPKTLRSKMKSKHHTSLMPLARLRWRAFIPLPKARFLLVFLGTFKPSPSRRPQTNPPRPPKTEKIDTPPTRLVLVYGYFYTRRITSQK